MKPPTDQIAKDSVPQPDAAIAPVMPVRKQRSSIRGWILPIAVGLFLFLMLLGIALPTFNTVNVKGARTKALAQAKQIGLALRLYASDNDGVFPAGTNLGGEALHTSNDAFAALFPTYTQSESIFGNELSKYQSSAGPDNVIDNPYAPSHPNTLKPGENVYAYVVGLTDKDDPTWPLIADGTDGTGHYVTDQNARGGVWNGTQAIVIHPDMSGALENLTGPKHARYIPRAGHPTQNLLNVGAYMGPKAILFDPALPPAAKK